MKNEKRILAIICAAAMLVTGFNAAGSAAAAENGTALTRQMEYLNRGVTAVMSNGGVYIGWRLLVTDSADQLFDVYRSIDGAAPVKIASPDIKTGTNCVDTDVTTSTWDENKTYTYYVVPAEAGIDISDTGSSCTLQNSTTAVFKENSSNNVSGYTIPLSGGQNGRGIRNVWVGDFDGDGGYDFALTRVGEYTTAAEAPIEETTESPSAAPDTSSEDSDTTESGKLTQQLEVYKSDGTILWSMDYGKNSLDLTRTHPGSAVIGVGQWDGVEVYDLNCDGKAEVISLLANYVTLPNGEVWLEGADDYTQYIGVFDGLTGDLMTYAPIPKDYYGDGAQGGLITGIAYLDGETPSLIVNWKNRGTDGYFHCLILAYKMYGAALKLQWKFDRGADEWSDAGYALDDTPGGQKDGHQIRIADIDNDGKDEICHLSFAVDDDGTLKYQLNDGGKWSDGVYNGDYYIKHGDRFFVGKFDKDDTDLMGYGVQQYNPAGVLEYYYNAHTGKVLWVRQDKSKSLDIGRGDVGDIDPDHAGWEFWSFYGVCNPALSGDKVAVTQITGAAGADTNTKDPYPAIGVWYDGDLLRENMIDTVVNKWDASAKSSKRYKTLYKSGFGMTRNDRKTPLFVGDMIGDWREEIIVTNGSYDSLVIYTSADVTQYRLYCLAQDPLYRNCMALKGYVESHQVSYYLGSDMDMDSNGQPDLSKTKPFISIIPKSAPIQKSLKVSGVKKLYYHTGESFDNTMTVTYTENGSSSTVAGYTVTGFDSSKTGRQTVQIHYNGCMDSFDVFVCDSNGTLKYEDFEGTTHTAIYKAHDSANTSVLGTEENTINNNTTKIFGINKKSDIAWWMAPHEMADKSSVEFDFKLDAPANDGHSVSLALLGYAKSDFKSDDDTAGRGKSIISIAGTASSNGYFNAITLNKEDITEKAVVRGKANDSDTGYTKSEASSFSALRRDSTGWLHMKVDFDFGTRRADVKLTRKSDSSTVYEGSLNIGSTITGFREIFMRKSSDGYSGVYIDNISAGIDTRLFDKDFRTSDITAAERFDYTNDSTLKYDDSMGFTASFSVGEVAKSYINWYLSKDGGKSYVWYDRDALPTISGGGEIKGSGFAIYNIPENLKNKALTVGYTIE